MLQSELDLRTPDKTGKAWLTQKAPKSLGVPGSGQCRRYRERLPTGRFVVDQIGRQSSPDGPLAVDRPGCSPRPPLSPKSPCGDGLGASNLQ